MPKLKQKSTPKPSRAIIYTRVSPRGDGSGGLSLEAQAHHAKLYAELYKLTVVAEVCDEHVSGKTLKRPGLKRALAMLEAGEADCLLVAKLDRLTRSVRGLGELLEGHFADGRYALLSVAEQIDTRSAAGRLVLNVLVSVAQWEREATVERTKVALAMKKAKGELTGTAPYGSDAIEGKLIPNPVEQKVVEHMRGLRAQGHSLRGIVTDLNGRHIPARGKRWHLTTVARILAG